MEPIAWNEDSDPIDWGLQQLHDLARSNDGIKRYKMLSDTEKVAIAEAIAIVARIKRENYNAAAGGAMLPSFGWIESNPRLAAATDRIHQHPWLTVSDIPMAPDLINTTANIPAEPQAPDPNELINEPETQIPERSQQRTFFVPQRRR